MYPIQDLARQRVDELRQTADELHQGRAPRVPDLDVEPALVVTARTVAPTVRTPRASGCGPAPSVAVSHR